MLKWKFLNSFLHWYWTIHFPALISLALEQISLTKFSPTLYYYFLDITTYSLNTTVQMPPQFLQGRSVGFFLLWDDFGARTNQQFLQISKAIPARFSTPQIPHNFSQKTLHSVTSHPRVLLTIFLLFIYVLKSPIFQGFSHYLEVTLSTNYLLM